MSEPSLVSSIIIFLNEERFVGEAIESVLSQSYPHWELLLVDDGSSDGSTALAQRYAASYPKRIRYLEHPGHANRGMSASRNLGISQARGEYLAFLDADDIWLPHKLERRVALLEKLPEAGLLYGPTLFWYSWSGEATDREHDAVQNLEVKPGSLIKPPELLRLQIRNRGYGPATSSAVLRRSIITEVGGFEEQFTTLYEDGVFWSKVYLKIPAYIADDCLEKYRQHPASTTAIAIKKGEFDLFKPCPAHKNYLNWLENYLRGQEVTDLKIWKALQKELWPYRYPRLYRLSRIFPYLSSQFKKLLRQILPAAFYQKLRANWRALLKQR
jgi:glycosyltransferase involved in cell wall biosynthesis